MWIYDVQEAEKDVLPPEEYEAGQESTDKYECPECGTVTREAGGVVFCPKCGYKEIF